MQISFRQQRFDTGDIIFLLIHTLHNDRMDNRIDSGGKTLIRDARSSIRLPVQGIYAHDIPVEQRRHGFPFRYAVKSDNHPYIHRVFGDP